MPHIHTEAPAPHTDTKATTQHTYVETTPIIHGTEATIPDYQTWRVASGEGGVASGEGAGG